MNAIAIEITEQSSFNTTTAVQSERHFNFEEAHFALIKSAWKKSAQEKRLNSASLAAWALIRGVDPKKGFTPISNPSKLANGQREWDAYETAMHSCSRLACHALSPWEEMLTQQGAILKGYQWSGDHPLLALLSQSEI